jgi:hypothetical protein
MAAVLSAAAGCASQVTVAPGHEGTKPEVRALETYTVEVSPQAKLQLPKDVKFDVDALNRAIGEVLSARNLVAADGDFQLKLVVTDVRVRSTFDAIMWGFMAGDDSVNGDGLLFRKGEDSPGYQFTVKTSYALGGFGGGQDAVRMEWIYKEFAKKVADHLAEKRDAKKS